LLKGLDLEPIEELRAEYDPQGEASDIKKDKLTSLSKGPALLRTLLATMKVGEVSTFFVVDPPAQSLATISDGLFNKELASCEVLVLTVACRRKSSDQLQRA